MNMMWPRTMQASLDAAEVDWEAFGPAHKAAAHLFRAKDASDAFNLALVEVTMGLFRKETVPSALIVGAIHTMVHAVIGRPAVGRKLVELGVIGLAVATLRQTVPTEWVSAAAAVRPGFSGYCFFLVKELVEAVANEGTDITAELLSSGYIDAVISGMEAVSQISSAMELCVSSICFGLLGSILAINSGACLAQIESKLRGSTAVKAAVRYLIDQDLIWSVGMAGFSTGMFGTMAAVSLWGREEDDGDSFRFSQPHIDALLAHCTELMHPGSALSADASYGSIWTLDRFQFRHVLNLCISDTGKQLLLDSSGGNGLVRHLIDGLLVDPKNPRQHEAAAHVKAAVQRDSAECIQQLSLYQPGLQALKADQTCMRAMVALAAAQEEGGVALTAEARVCARNTLLTLNASLQQRGQTDYSHKLEKKSEQKHVMVRHSYECLSRIVCEKTMHGRLIGGTLVGRADELPME
eukprot:SAG31_NODE_1350_length_8681_cov_14.408879_4_plen_466_part_00